MFSFSPFDFKYSHHAFSHGILWMREEVMSHKAEKIIYVNWINIFYAISCSYLLMIFIHVQFRLLENSQRKIYFSKNKISIPLMGAEINVFRLELWTLQLIWFLSQILYFFSWLTLQLDYVKCFHSTQHSSWSCPAFLIIHSFILKVRSNSCVEIVVCTLWWY